MKFSNLSITLDGVDEYVTMGDVLGFDYNEAFSYSFWVKTTSTSGYALAKIEGAPDYRGFGANFQAGGVLRIHFINVNASTRLTVDTTTRVATGVWVHVVVTYDGSALASGVHCYINGVDDTLSVVLDALGSNTILTTAELNLGGRTNGTLLLVGKLDEVAVYSKELSSVEAAWIFNDGMPNDLTKTGAPSNLVGWWRCGDDDTYPTLTDNSTNSYDGTMTNMEAADFVGDTPGGIGAVYQPLRDKVWTEMKVYTMRAWDTVDSQWVFWRSNWSPTASPYAHPVVYTTIVKVTSVEVRI